MAERSLIEQLDQAVEALIAHPGSAPPAVEPELATLVHIAAELRDLPGEEFREQLKSDLERTATMDTTTVKPVREGFHTLTPYFVVEGASELMEFLQQAFDAEEILRVPKPDGTLMHAEARIADSMVEMADATPQYAAMEAAVHLYVPDADAAYRRALEAGATSLYKPMDQEYGDREAGVRDPFGNNWYIGTHKGASHIPGVLRSVTPILHPKGAAGMIDFLKQAFGAEEIARYESPQGAILHAKVGLGDSVLEMGETHGQFQPRPCLLHLYVDNADAVYRAALQAGATSVFEPRDEAYGDRVACVTDPHGNLWAIATHIKDVQP
jgi:uncharacterized glyoxalase superfamily protein PhnB